MTDAVLPFSDSYHINPVYVPLKVLLALLAMVRLVILWLREGSNIHVLYQNKALLSLISQEIHLALQFQKHL